MNGSMVILVSSAGRRVGLIECFRSSAKALGLDLRVLAVDVNPRMSSACVAADKCFQVPRCTTAEFMPELAVICRRENVQLVVPTIDTELQMLADHQQEFAVPGARVVISSPSIIRMARDKAATGRFLGENGIPTPRTGLLGELLRDPDSWCWPVILKPVNGSSSVGIRRAENLDDARLAALEREDYVAQELLSGREYTVNLFFDQAGIMRAAVPHYRYEVRGGEISKGITERQPALVNLAWRVGSVLKGAYGPMCFQAIVSEDGQARIFEINARFGGGYPLAHQAGAAFTRWLLEDAAGLRSTANDDWEAGVVMLRYDAAVFSHE
jgi:carbamoyl-phosphate synthase large subunit